MSLSLKDTCLQTIEGLLLDCTKVTILASKVHFEDDSVSQDVALAVLADMEMTIICLLRHILQPRSHYRPTNGLFKAALLSCTGAVHLLERRLLFYKSTSHGRQHDHRSWLHLMETLQHNTINLQRLTDSLNPFCPSPIRDVSTLQRLIDHQRDEVIRDLQEQLRLEGRLRVDFYHAQDVREISDDPSSNYATPPGSIAGDNMQDELPIPGPPLQTPPASSQQQDRDAIECGRTEERTKIYATLQAVWLPGHEDPKTGSKCLLYAINLALVNGVDLLLDLGVNVNQPYEEDLPLCLAAKKGYDEILKVLLQRGADVDRQSPLGDTALMSAAAAGHTSTIDILLDHGANREARSASTIVKGYTPLMYAVASGQQNSIKQLSQAGADTKTQNDAGESLLHVAIQRGRKEIIYQVLQMNPPIGVTDSHGNTVLHLAATNGLVDVSGELIWQMKSLVKIGNRRHETPLHHAVKAKSVELVRLFLHHEAFAESHDENEKTPLHYAVEVESQEIVELLLDESAAPCSRDKDGKMPLHYAVDLASKGIIQALAESMPSVDAKDKNKQTPLHYAVKSANPEVVQLLLAHKATANTKDRAGKVPLEYVMEMPQSDEEVILRLLREFLKVHEKGHSLINTFGFPALSKAAREGWTKVVREICEHDPGLTSEAPPLDSDFDPALHEAIKSGHRDCVEMLCSLQEADNNVIDRDGNTPLHQAIIHWQDGLLGMLISNGADKDSPHATTGLPPIHFAAQMQSKKKVDELLNNKAEPDKRVPGEQCAWCKRNNRPPGMNARCVLQAIPEAQRTSEYRAVSIRLAQAIMPFGQGRTVTVSSYSSSPRKRKAKSYYRWI